MAARSLEPQKSGRVFIRWSLRKSIWRFTDKPSRKTQISNSKIENKTLAAKKRKERKIK
jgi:hypothetical protein